MHDKTSIYRVALVGNPNSGKTTLFNALTGENQKVGNYSGVTVSKRVGRLRSLQGDKIELIDLPGCYSLHPSSPDEKVTSDVLHGKLEGEMIPDLVVCVVDSSAMERHLSLVCDVMELGVPVVVALNMVDVAERNGVHLDPIKLSEEFNVPVVAMQANKGKGLVKLKQAIAKPLPPAPEPAWMLLDEPLRDGARLEKIQHVCQLAARRESTSSLTFTDKLDQYLLNPWCGWLVLCAVMFAVFYSLFALSSYPMDLVESLFSGMGDWVRSAMPAGDLRDLIVDGVISGISGTVIFLPQIIILFLCIGLMESTGYMSRASYTVDALMSKVGLSGSSFLPLLSAHACAVPGIMAARTIDSARGRLITILIAPWMSCSARLPVYTTIIALLLPANPLWQKALIMLAIYSLGIISALIAALVLKKKLPGDEQETHFMLELPPYRMPDFGYLWRHIVERSKSFLVRAGTVILGISILIWALQTYPKPAEGSPAADDPALALEQSYMGQIGKAVEPVVKPLGYDWRTGTAVMASFAAREVFISNLSITFAAEDEDTDRAQKKLEQKLAAATWPDGRKLYTVPTLLSILIFFIYALQCFPTTVVVARETNSWKWATVQLVAMTTVAYLAALAVFQIGSLL